MSADALDDADPCDQTEFVLHDKQWRAFTARLAEPPQPNPRLRRLFTTKALWEREHEEKK